MTDTNMNTVDMGTKYWSSHKEENVVGVDTTVLQRKAWNGYDGGRFERGRTDIERNDCHVCDCAQYNSGSFHGRSLLVDLLACEPGYGYRGGALLGASTRSRSRENAEGRRNGCDKHLTKWCPQSQHRSLVS